MLYLPVLFGVGFQFVHPCYTLITDTKRFVAILYYTFTHMDVWIWQEAESLSKLFFLTFSFEYSSSFWACFQQIINNICNNS